MCPAEKPNVYRLSGDIAGTQDPSIIKEGKTWYVFATGKAPGGGQIAVRCSGDLEHWKLCGHVFDAIPAWILERSTGTKDLRAPDISYVHHEYRLYYAYSLFGKNTSGIALATNKSLDPTNPSYKWTDKGLVLESKAEDNFNAIDPNFVLDGKGGEWLAFGRGGFMDTTVHPVPRSLGKRRYRTLDEKRRIVEETLYITLADGPRSKHGLVFRSPVINISRDPRWGRIQEVFSEDPFLTGRMGVANIQGLQDDNPRYIKVAATVKHFAVNNVETNRQRLSVEVSERNLMEYWLPHWKAAIVEGHAQSVMASYNAINGAPDAINKYLLTDILREQWKFDGFVTDDLGGVNLLVQERTSLLLSRGCST